MAEEKKSRYSKAQNIATQKYIKENLEEIRFRVRIGEKEKYKLAAERFGLSMAKFFLKAADEKIERDTSQPSAADCGELPPDAAKTAKEAASVTGESTAQFIGRAIKEQAGRDQKLLAMGINPAEE